MAALINSVSTPSYSIDPAAACAVEAPPAAPLKGPVHGLHDIFLQEISTCWGASSNDLAKQTLDDFRGILRELGVWICASIKSGGYGNVYKMIGAKGIARAVKITRMFPINDQGRALKVTRSLRYNNHSGAAAASRFKDPHAITPDTLLYFSYELKKLVSQEQANEGDYQLVSIMSFCEGSDLAVRLEMDESFSDEQILRIAHVAARTLRNAHGWGLAHQDIKLDNIILDEEGEIRLVDWDLALQFLANQATREYRRCGTPYYMAPEVETRMKMCTIGAPDMYALGWVLFTLKHPEEMQELRKAFNTAVAAPGGPRPTWDAMSRDIALRHCRHDVPPTLHNLLEQMWAPQEKRAKALQIEMQTALLHK